MKGTRTSIWEPVRHPHLLFYLGSEAGSAAGTSKRNVLSKLSAFLAKTAALPPARLLYRTGKKALVTNTPWQSQEALPKILQNTCNWEKMSRNSISRKWVEEDESQFEKHNIGVQCQERPV